MFLNGQRPQFKSLTIKRLSEGLCSKRDKDRESKG